MSLSFQEKSLGLLFVGLVGSFGFYFVNAVSSIVPMENGPNVLPPQVALFAVAVALLTAVQVIGHVVLAIFDRRTDTDERDRLIALKGTRNGAYVLATGVFCALCAAVLTAGNFIFTHVLLGFWVLAQLVEIASQLYYYRRGA